MRIMSYRYWTIGLLLLAAGGAHADEASIVFDLERPSGTTASAKLPAPKPSASATKAPPSRTKVPSPSRNQSATRSLTESGKLVGRIGVVTWYNAPILDRPKYTQIYNVLQPGANIILIGYNDDYYGVKMVDGRMGWIRKTYVKLLDVAMMVDPPTRGAPPLGGAGVSHSLLQTAYGYMGIPYRWGGTSSNGIDCSGFVQSVFRKHGVSLPRVARDQARVGAIVPGVPGSLEGLLPGDRLYFACNHSYVDHTGIYIGAGYFIHSAGGRGVGIDHLPSSSTYRKGLVSARRF